MATKGPERTQSLAELESTGQGDRPPKAATAANESEWETKSLVERRPTGKRPYAMKQVDKPAAKNSESPPAIKLSPKSIEFKSLMNTQQPSPLLPPVGEHGPKPIPAIKPTKQHYYSQSDAFDAQGSITDYIPSAVEATAGGERSENHFPSRRSEKKESVPAKTKFSKMSGIKLIKMDTSNGRNTITQMDVTSG